MSNLLPWQRTRWLPALAASAVLGCGPGTIGPVGSGDPDASPPFQGAGATSGTPTPNDGSPGGDPLDDPGDPSFTFASVGTRCVDGTLQDWLVLSRDPVDCAAHANFNDAPSPAFVRVPLSESPAGETIVRVPLCLSAADCAERDVILAVSRFEPGGPLEGSWSADLGDRLVGAPIEATRCAYEPLDNPARAVRVTDVLVNQGVAVTLGEDGTPVAVNARTAPVVAGRDAVFQIGVEPEEDWRPRDLVAEVRADGAIIGTQQEFVQGATVTSDPDTMIAVEVPGDRISAGASVSVGLFEIASCVDQPGSVLEPMFPPSGTVDLGARSMAGPFRVVLVPIRWNSDGSGRLPDLSSPVVADFANRIRALFPVDDVEVTVRTQPLDYDGALDPAGNGWSQLLNECLSLRASDGGADQVYYYCVFQPTSDIREFCSESCVAGIGPVPSASDTYRRAAIGISFDGSGVGTFVHEIGHALGRPHAPCGGVSGSDPAYPYADARIGVWGYDLIEDAHVPPDFRDMMSYCGPAWISDYNYDLLFNRIESVYGSLALKSLNTPARHLTVVVDADMTLSWGRSVMLRDAPEGEPIAVDFLDAAGRTLDTTTGVYQPVTHIAGGLLMVPVPDVAVSAVRIDGFGTLGN